MSTGNAGNSQYNSRNATVDRPQNQGGNGSWRPPVEKPSQLPEVQGASAVGAALDALIMDQATAGREMAAAFDRCIDKIAELLPDSLKKDASRFVRRAMLYFSRREELTECTIGSKIKCVLDAAELGLALDGRLCHAVSYNVKVKFKNPQGHERERWEKQAQCQPDYKGLLVVARRCGQIADAYGDVVCENDHFKHGRNGGNNVLEHTFEIAQNRGNVVGAYVIIKFPAGDWRYDLMSIDELNAIQRRSKSGGKGPWATDTNEMRKKTVLRRGLKMYCDDPGVMKALEIEDREYETDGGAWIPQTQGKVRPSALTEMFKTPNSPGGTVTPPSGQNGNGHGDDANGRQQDDDGPPLDEPRGMPRQNDDYGDTGTQREPGDEPFGDGPDFGNDDAGGTIPMRQAGNQSNQGGDPDGLAGLDRDLKACKSLGAVMALKQNWPTGGLSQQQLLQLDAECAARTAELKAQKNTAAR